MEVLFKKVSKILYNDIFNDNDIASATKRKIKTVALQEANVSKKKCC